MDNLFKNNIFDEIQPPHNFKANLLNTALPKNQDIYFVSKWNELFKRYQAARIFIRKTQENNWDYWFNPIPDPKVQKGVELTFKSNLYETALINYNILVDLSWTLTYVSAEFVLYEFDKQGKLLIAKEIRGMHSIEEAYKLLRKTENSVSSPNANGNPFMYLKTMLPKFSPAVDLIIDFWKDFSDCDIRNLYNYIKHKGKPIYKEIEALRGGKIIGININDTAYPSDIRDVQKVIELEKAITDLVKFDDDILFPYIKKLINELKCAVDPSPFAYA